MGTPGGAGGWGGGAGNESAGRNVVSLPNGSGGRLFAESKKGVCSTVEGCKKILTIRLD